MKTTIQGHGIFKKLYPQIQNLYLWRMQAFILLFILSFPIGSKNIPEPAVFLQPFFSSCVEFTGKYVFMIGDDFSTELLSDSKALYIHLFNLYIFTWMISVLLKWKFKNKNESPAFKYWFIAAMSYYLAFHLISYGFNKVFKWQFFLPEPNTLFTTIGNTTKDLLYWSSMGSSYSYNVFTGLLEVIGGLFLLFRKTRLSGALFAFAILLNVVMINFSFDISVKVFSLFLLLISVMIISPHFKNLYSFFIREEMLQIKSFRPDVNSLNKKRIYVTLKLFVIGYLFFDSLGMYIRTGNFNDDLAKRPLFHGAYEVKNGANGWKKAFVHRRGYFIIQTEDEKMHDFKLEYDITNKKTHSGKRIYTR